MSEKKARPDTDREKELCLLGKLLDFPDEQAPLLRLAMTHSTFYEGSRHGGPEKGDDNQRLEFLGDAVLDLIVGEELYRLYPDAREGQLSKMRAYLVCEASLAEDAAKLRIQHCLRMGRGAESGGDRFRPSVLADAFEAMVGAIFLAQGYDHARAFLLSRFQQAMEHLTPEDYEDKKSLLQELIQGKGCHGVNYRVLEQSGPDHHPHFRSAVYCGNLLLGTGEGGSKKESEVAAAGAALKKKEEWLDSIE